MISVSEAERIITASVRKVGVEACPISGAEGRILREDIRADRDYPPYNRSTMDGVAIGHKAWARGQRVFLIEGVLQAGRPAKHLKDLHTGCLQIMTGAVVPENADCIIPVEQLTIDGKRVTVEGDAKAGQFIHRRGSDRKKGDLLIPKGCRLNGPQIAVIASTGKKSVFVGARPSVAVISTGDELVPLGRRVKDFQIRPSNAYGIRASLQARGIREVGVFHVRDDRAKIRALFTNVLRGFDVVIVTGGVSMGKFDFVPEILNQLGIRPRFHKVSQKPGKPFWFGLSRKKQPVFALPGNPVSTMVCLHRYVLPSLERAMGLTFSVEKLTASAMARARLTLFLPVKKVNDRAVPELYGGSGDLAALSESDGFIELPPGGPSRAAGSLVDYRAW